MTDPIEHIYSRIGSEEPFYKLVEAFYAEVENDPLLRPLYPSDLSDAKKHLAKFLIQRTGGAQTYSMERGHPRMRMRHLRFSIGQEERDAWMKHMTHAVKTTPEFVPDQEALLHFFAEFATFLINK